MRIPFTKYEIRSAKLPKPDPYSDFWFDPGNRFQTTSGAEITEDSALRNFAVWACVKVISEDIASLPLFIYRRNGTSKEKAIDHPVYHLLHDAPNREMTAMQFRETLQAHVLLYGNAYAAIERNQMGEVISLWPMRPDRMTPKRDPDTKALYYQFASTDGENVIYRKSEILHIPGLGFNGIVGYSVIGYQREAIAQGLVQQDFSNQTLSNGARLSLALVHPAPKAPAKDARDKFREEIRREYAGKSNAGKIAVFWEGMEPKSIPSMTNEDAQFVDTWKFNRTQICAIFRVPPQKIMDLERATFSNIESQDTSYAKDTLRPWCVQWEQCINQRILEESQDYFVEHSLAAIMRGDIKTRYDAYAVGRQWGWLSINDVRDLENMNPVEDGDEYLTPLNMTTLGSESEQEAPQGTAQDQQGPVELLKIAGRK